jgi:hypothetical protein
MPEEPDVVEGVSHMSLTDAELQEGLETAAGAALGVTVADQSQSWQSAFSATSRRSRRDRTSGVYEDVAAAIDGVKDMSRQVKFSSLLVRCMYLTFASGTGYVPFPPFIAFVFNTIVFEGSWVRTSFYPSHEPTIF